MLDRIRAPGRSSHTPVIASSSATSPTTATLAAVYSSATVASSIASSVGMESSVVSQGILELTPPELCGLMMEYQSLRQAEIISTEVYAERRTGLDRLCLVSELRFDGRNTLHLRLGGQKGGKLTRVLFGSEGAASNHTVRCLGTIFASK